MRRSQLGRALALGLLALLLAACAGIAGTAGNAPPTPGPPVRTFPPPAAVTPLPAPVVPTVLPATPTPAPTPAPARPHDYAIEGVAVTELSGEGDDRSARFEVRIVNSGGELGIVPIPVTMAIGDGDPRVIHVIEDPSEGSVLHVSPVADVEGGVHTAVFSVAGKSRRLVFDVPAPDLAILLEPVSLTEDGLLLITARVENVGDQRARLSEVVGSWAAASQGGNWFLINPSSSSSPRQFSRRIQYLEPSEVRTIKVWARPPQGEHRVTFRVRSFGYDQDLSNNVASASFDAQLAPLDVESASAEPVGWLTPGSGLIDIAIRIRNRGEYVAAVPVGLVFAETVAGAEQPKTALAGRPRCGDVLEEGCWLELGRAHLAAGVETTLSFRRDLPAGEHELVAFAGEPGRELGWLGEYFHRLPVQVPAQPPTLLRADLSARVTGYYADGTARIELNGRLSNSGFRAYLGPVPFAIACQLYDSVADVPGCGEQPVVRMADGFGPVPFTAELRAPLGSRVDIGAVFGQSDRQLTQVTVPVNLNHLLSLDLQTSVRGYWSDGTATIQINGSLARDGELQINEPVPLSLTCQVDVGEANECGKQPALSLAGDTESAPFEAKLRVPMGAQVAIEARFGGLARHSIQVTVPERILGVERSLWECYTQRDTYTDSGWQDACSGMWWPGVRKWDQPVRIWHTGDAVYAPGLRAAVEKYCPLLNLECEFVGEEEAANVRAYLGMPCSRTEEVGFGCRTDTEGVVAGVAITYFGGDGKVSKGKFVVWPVAWTGDKGRDFVIAHELLHIIAPIGHRDAPEFVLGSWIDPVTEALLRLNAHPLLRPGMSLEQARELIVLEDELLDARAGPDSDR